MNQRLSLAAGAGLALAALVAWTVFTGDGPNQSKTEANSTTSTFHVDGMTCGGCEVGVRRVVKKLDGVKQVEASHKEKTAVVTYRADKVTPDDIIAAIEELGYTAELEGAEEQDT